MERPVKTASKLVPKMFKTFVLYIFITLAVFYGYIQIYGNITNDNGLIDPTPGQAEDETFFGNFVTNLMSFQNVDTDLSFSIDNDQFYLGLTGNVMFELASTGLYVDLDLDYREKDIVSMASVVSESESEASSIFKIVLTYNAPYLYVRLSDEYYKFDCDGDLNFEKIIGLIKENVKFDEKSLGDILAKIGLGDVNVGAMIQDVMNQFNQEPAKDSKGNYRLSVNVSNLIKAHIVCDSNYNLTSVRLDNGTIIKGNALTFEAKNIQMNCPGLDVTFDESSVEIVDMSGLTDYLGYGQNLLNNQFVNAQLSLNLAGQEYLADLILDNSQSVKAKLATNFEGVDVELAYANEEIYLDIANVKLKIKTKDYESWKVKINSIVEKQTSKKVSQLVTELLDKFVSVDIENVDIYKAIMGVLAGGENSQEKLALYLPKQTQLLEDSFAMTFDNGMVVKLYSQDQMLTQINASCDQVNVVANFVVSDHGFEIMGEYYDVTSLLPLADVVDEILSSEAMEGSLIINVCGEKIDCDYVLNFADDVELKISTYMFGENIEVYLQNKNVFLKVGGVVVEGNLGNVKDYISKIKQMFSVEIPDFDIPEVNVVETVETVCEILNNILIYAQDDALLAVSYLSYVGSLNFVDDVVTINVVINDSLSFEASATESNKKVQVPTATDSVDSVFEKIEKVKALIGSQQYAAAFEVSYNQQTISGEARVDLKNKIYQVTLNNVGNHDITLTYKDDNVYVEYAENKIKLNITSAMNLKDIALPIILANFPQEEKEEVEVEEVSLLTKVLTEIFGEDVSELSVQEILEKITISLEGTLTKFVLTGSFASEIEQSAQIEVEFKENDLSKLAINALDAEIALEIKNYVAPEITEIEYFDLTSKMSGSVAIEYSGYNLEAEVEIDLTENLYLTLTTEVLEETIELTILNNDMFLKIGEVDFYTDLNNAKSLIKEVLKEFGLSIPEIKVETNIDANEILSTLDLNAIDPITYIEGLTWAIDGKDLEIIFDNDEVKINASLENDVDVKVKDVPAKDTCEALSALLEKIKDVKSLIGKEQYAGAFEILYKNIDIAGSVRADLKNDAYEVCVDSIGQNALRIVYLNNIAYLTYANNNVAIEVENVEKLTTILMPLISQFMPEKDSKQNSSADKSLLAEVLTEIFGEDVSMLSVKEIIEKLAVDVKGNLAKLVLSGKFSSKVEQNANATIEFLENALNKVSIKLNDELAVSLTLEEFETPEVDETEYFDLTSKMSGSVQIGLPAGLTLTANVAIDLTDKVYLRADLQNFGKSVSVVVFNDQIYLNIANYQIHKNISESQDLIEKLLSMLNIGGEKASIDIKEVLASINLNAVDALSAIDGLLWSVDAKNGLAIDYENESFSISARFENDENVEVDISAPKDFALESTFSLEYNGWPFIGTLKYSETQDDRVIEIVVSNVSGANVVIRVQNDVVYFTYGNLTYKYQIPKKDKISNEEKQTFKQILQKITADTFGVEIDFGEFLDVVEMLRDFSIDDYKNNIKYDLTLDESSVNVVLKNINSKLMGISVVFDKNEIASIDLNIKNIIVANLVPKFVETSTLTPFNPEDYKDYGDDFIEGMLDSLEYDKNVYVFASDIDIRYSTNSFAGELAVMLVKQDGYEGFIKNYKPAISVHTTALGLNSYIYLVDQTIYVDINGFQISAKVNEDSIEEILAFIEKNFSKQENEEVGEQEESEETSEEISKFRTILPAITSLYGYWVDGGVKLTSNGKLQYGQNAFFSDLILKALIEIDGNMIVPTQIILGANITDKNTEIYETGYSEYAMDCEEDLTKALNFAIYLSSVKVGHNVEGLEDIFVISEEQTKDYSNILSLKSNAGNSAFSEFNDYKIVLDAAQTVLDYGLSMNYSFNINASIAGEKTTPITGNIIASLSDDVEKKAQYKLLDDKILKVHGDLGFGSQERNVDGVTKTIPMHEVSVLYDNLEAGLYLTYAHGALIGNNSFKAKIGNANMSDIISMACGFLNINLSEKIMEEMQLSKNKTDFRYLRTLMKLKEPEETSISKTDSTLSMITKYLSKVKSFTINKTLIENEEQLELYQTVLTIAIDLEEENKENKQLSVISIVLKEELIDGEVVENLRTIDLSHLVLGKNVINATLNINDFKESDYDYNTQEEHIDFSNISSFLDAAVNTLNTKGYNFTGNTNVKISTLYNIAVAFDLSVTFDAENNMKMHLELEVGYIQGVTCSIIINPKYTTYVLRGGGFDKRVSTLDYDSKTKKLNIIQTTYGNKESASSLSKKKDVVKKWTHNSSEIGSKFMEILAEALGLSETVYGVIDYAIQKIDAHPTLEEAILGFGFDGSNYTIKINAENLTGMSGVKDMTLRLGMSNDYTANVNVDGLAKGIKTLKFIDNIETEFNISDIVVIPLTLVSKSGTSYVAHTEKSGEEKKYITFYTNDYYRRQYINSLENVA